MEGPLGPRNFFVDGKKICPQCGKEKTINEYGKNSLSWCKACQVLRHKKEKYGLSPADYQTVLANGCEICGSHEALVIDHNHQTNHIRGVLCHHCNSGLGLFRDNPAILESAIDYLKRSTTLPIPSHEEKTNEAD